MNPEGFLVVNLSLKNKALIYDNDVDGRDAKGQPHNHGQVQAVLSAEAFRKAGYRVYIQTPQKKDFNEDLMAFLGRMEQEQTQEQER